MNLDSLNSQNNSYKVEGYATTFDTYELTKDMDGNPIYERFERSAFDGLDMSDVILQYDHEGYVYARSSNGTLALSVDDKGLRISADLSKTTRSKLLYEDIAQENVNSMSICCSVESDFDLDTNTHIIRKVNRIYDVSAVSIPANDNTVIVARKKDAADTVKRLKDNEEEKKLKTLMEMKIKIGEME